jgi:phosphotransferase system IIA component
LEEIDFYPPIHGSLNQLKAIDDRPFEHGSLNGSGLLVEETEVTGENHRPVANHRQTLSHNVVSSISRHERELNSQL